MKAWGARVWKNEFLEREAEADSKGNGKTVSQNSWEYQLQQQDNMHNVGQHTGQLFMQPHPEKDMLLMMMMMMMMIF